MYCSAQEIFELLETTERAYSKCPDNYISNGFSVRSDTCTSVVLVLCCVLALTTRFNELLEIGLDGLLKDESSIRKERNEENSFTASPTFVER